jgi:hypothetical protein
MEKYYCDFPDCGLEPEFVSFIGELVVVPIAKPVTRKPQALMREFLVRCRVHDFRWIQIEGHHLTTDRSGKGESVPVPCRYRCGWKIPFRDFDPAIVKSHEVNCRSNPNKGSE